MYIYIYINVCVCVCVCVCVYATHPPQASCDTTSFSKRSTDGLNLVLYFPFPGLPIQV